MYLNYIAYHVQQSVEKMLKLQLELLALEYPRTYNIAVLVDKYLDAGISVPELIQDYDVIITVWATGTRYDSWFVTSKRQLNKVIDCLKQWFEELKFE